MYWETCKEIDLSHIVLHRDVNETRSIVSANVRPDGKYAAAIVLEEEPDFPELWVIDMTDQRVIKFDSEELINWSIERVIWPENNMTLLVFDRNTGISSLTVDLEECTFIVSSVARDPSAFEYEKWFVRIHNSNCAHWTRLRMFTEDFGQIYDLAYDDRPLFKYFHDWYYQSRKYRHEWLARQGTHIWLNDAGEPMVDKWSVGDAYRVTKNEAQEIQQLLNDKKIVLPTGSSEAEIGNRLHQTWE